MARSRRIPGRLEVGVSLKAFEEREREREEGRGEGRGKRDRENDLVTKPPRTLLSEIRLQDDKGPYDELLFRLISLGSGPAGFRLS